MPDMYVAGVASGIIAFGTLDILVMYVQKIRARRAKRKAETFLRVRGIFPQLYLATVGIENTEIRDALMHFGGSFIFTSITGDVVGKVCPGIHDRVPQLKLVVVND